jgi:hypothetical protein
MRITFADTFFKSLEKLKMHETWWYKLYHYFRYDIPNFFRNIWLFRKELMNFQWWDYSYTLQMFSRCLVLMEKETDKRGMEIPETKNLKLKKMRRAVEILNNIDEFHYIEKAEKEMGELKEINIFTNDNNPDDVDYNRRIYLRAERLKEMEWEELWDIIRGTKKLSIIIKILMVLIFAPGGIK